MLDIAELGFIVLTPGMLKNIHNKPDRIAEVQKAFERYMREDWGNLDSHDWEIVDSRRKNDTGALQGAYDLSFSEIFIITEIDRSVTTILLPIER